jgi:DNA-binding CsgD family transcriptional regulator
MAPAAREVTDLVVAALDGLGDPRGAECPRLPVDAVAAVLCPRLDSPAVVLQCVTWRTGESEITLRGVDSVHVPLLDAATRRMRQRHPLMAANARGDLTPLTARTAAGGTLAWRRSPARAFLLDLSGWDQQVSLPLRGGAEVSAFVFARAGADFGERELALLAAVQPALRALDRHVRLLARWRGGAGPAAAAAAESARACGLTGREIGVLQCLAEGLTAAAVAHRLGCAVRTVTTHTSSLYRKLGVHDRLAAVLEAQRRGILPAVSPGATPNARR